MALITCPECGKQISERATNCPNCGYPLHSQTTKQTRNGVKPKNSNQQKEVYPADSLDTKRTIGLIIGIIGVIAFIIMTIGFIADVPLVADDYYISGGHTWLYYVMWVAAITIPIAGALLKKNE